MKKTKPASPEEQKIKPYLIQRGKIVESPKKEVDMVLSRVVRFNEMGYAEFEFGALAQSFREIHALIRLATPIEPVLLTDFIDSYCLGKETVYFFCPKSLGYRHAYTEVLKGLYKNVYNLKVSSNFDPKSRKIYPKLITDFWWDIENLVIWSFNEKFMFKEFPNALLQSFRFMGLNNLNVKIKR